MRIGIDLNSVRENRVGVALGGRRLTMGQAVEVESDEGDVWDATVVELTDRWAAFEIDWSTCRDAT